MFKRIWLNSKFLFSRKQTNILSAALVIMTTYGFSMILGILRERLLVDKFFACCRPALDAYYAAFRLPDMIFQLVAIGALSAAFIPVFSSYLEKQSKQAYHFSSSFINHLLLFFALLALIIFLFARPLSDTITGSFSYYQVNLMAQMTRVMLLAQALFLISSFFSAILQSHQRFLIPALSPLAYNLGIILSIILFTPLWGIWAPVFGVLVGAFVHLLIQLPLSLKLGFSYQPIFDHKLPGINEVFRLMLPRTLALAVYQLEATVAVFLATSLSAGSLTIFYLAERLMGLPVRLFGTSIGQAAFPILSAQKAKSYRDKFRETLLSSLNQILYLALPAMAIILILRVPLVRLAYGAKSFPWQATILTSKTVGIFSLAIFSQAASQLLVRSFYALHDTKTPFFLGTISVAFNILLAIILTFRMNWGILGLATATTLASALQAGLLLIWLARKIPNLITADAILNWSKMAASTFFTAFALWFPMRFLDQFVLDTSRTFNLLLLTIVASLTGFLVYLLFSLILKIPEFYAFAELFRRLGHWQAIFKESEEVLAPDVDRQETRSAQ